MAYQRRYRKTFPLPLDQAGDDTLLVWLMRESFDRQAAGDALTIVEFTDLGMVPPEDINPKAEEQMGQSATEFMWRRFEGVAERPPDA